MYNTYIMELKVVYLNSKPHLYNFDIDGGNRVLDFKTLDEFDFKNLENSDNYINTMAGIGSELVINTDLRKSFTYNKRLILETPTEL